MAYQATIKKQDLCAIFDIKGKAGAVAQRLWHLDLQLPENANTASAKGGQHLCWVGEGHWILLANANYERQLHDSLSPDDPDMECRVVMVSDVYAFFSVTGDEADDILAIASPLDTRQPIFADNGATFTELFGIRALVLRQSDGYNIAVERSYADMITQYFDKISKGGR